MDVSSQNKTNDVPEHLNDLIPYRCPKCGHKRRFATLRELRLHLQNDHSFQMGFIKPHSRATIFNKEQYGTSNVSSDPTLNVHGKHNENLQEHRGNNGVRESSPLLRSFKDEANELEMELQRAKQNEMRNKAISMKNISNNQANNEYSIDFNNQMNARKNADQQKMKVTTPLANHLTRSQPLPREQLPDMKSTLDRLNAEVMKSRLDQWVTSDALYKSQDILLNMEEAAEENVREQQGVVRQLMQDIKLKGDRIEQREREHRELHCERQRLYNETEDLVKEADIYNQGLRQELNQRSVALDNLGIDMKRLQSVSEKQLKSKENDLQIAREKMQRLEWERDRLIDETENILKRADIDNIELRTTIKAKENELIVVNEELDKLRQNNHNLMEKTAEIQTRADESKVLMQSVLDAKNTQLESTVRQLHEMKALQVQLMEESKILTEQADSNTYSMKQMLESKEERVRQLMMELGRLREEKFRLEESTSSLEEKAERSLSVIDSLKDVVKNKERDLQTTQSDLADLKDFLQSAAAKERGARKKLEKFIDELIHRAEKAEAELRTLRSQSSHSLDSTKQADSRVQQMSTYDKGQNGAKSETIATPNRKEESQGFSDNSERLGLPTRLSPQKPPRTRRKSPVPDMRNVHGEIVKPDNSCGPAGDLNNKQNTITTKAVVHYDNNTTHHVLSNMDTQNDMMTCDYSLNKNSSPGKNVPENALPQSSANNDEDSNTLNTDSLIKYLNEGLLPSIDRHKVERKARFFSNNKSYPASLTHKNHPQTHRGLYDEISIRHLEGHPNYGDCQNEIFPIQTGRNEYDGYRSNVYKRRTNDMHIPIGASNSSRRKSLDYDPDLDRYLSRLKQESRYETISNNKEGRYRLGTDPRMLREIPARKNSEYFTRSKLLQSLLKSGDRRQYYDSNKRSSINRHSNHNQLSGLRRTPAVLKRTRDGLKKKGKLKQFDSTYPERHTSLHDLRRKSQWKDPDKRQHSSRRSRSLSPDVKVRKTSRSRTRYKKDRISPKHVSPVRRSYDNNVDSANSEEDDEKYALLLDSGDENSRCFVGLMDENGIMWASRESNVQIVDNGSETVEEADTLPDISDAELDRVSPSGSEAIATKKLNQTLQVSTRVKHIDDRKGKPLSRASTRMQHSDIDNSVSLGNSDETGKKSRDSSVFGKKPHSQITLDSNPVIYLNDDRYKKKRIVQISKDSKANEDQLGNEHAIFRPIIQHDISKHSISDKELTSGGREVHEYVKRSPEIYVKGSPVSASEKYSRYSSDNSSRLKRDEDMSETLEEKLKRISDKYKSQRIVIGSATKSPQKTAPAVGSSIDNKVKMISEKYKAKRQAIVKSKGVSGLTTENPGQRDKRSSATLPRGNLGAYSEHDQLQEIDTRPHSASATTVLNTSMPLNQSSQSERFGFPLKNLTPPLQVQLQPDGAGANFVSNQVPMLPNGVPYPPNAMPYMHSYHHGLNSPVGQMYNPYMPYHPNALPNITSQSGSHFPHIFPYFHSSSHLGLQQVTPTTPEDCDVDSRRRSDTREIDRLSTSKPIENSPDPKPIKYSKSQGSDILDDSTCAQIKACVENIQNHNDDVEMAKERSPLMKESDIETEKVSVTQQSSEYTEKTHTPNVNVGLDSIKLEDIKTTNTRSPLVQQINREKHNPTDDTTKQSACDMDENTEHLQTESNRDSSMISPGTSMFAAPIDDDYSTACNSNTQSVIGLQGSGIETDLDTDTESVKRDFFEKALKLRGMIGEMPDVDIDSVSQRSYRNAISSASSQASIDYLDNIPLSRREETKRRRQALSSIFRFLDTASLCKVAEVCREWKIVSRSPKLWKRIVLKNEKVSPKFLCFLARRASQLRVLIIEDVRSRNRRQEETIEDYQSSIKCSLDAAVEQILKRSEASLHTISIINCGTMLSSKCLWAASCYSRMLKHVNYVTDFDPVSSEVMWALGSGCRDLKTLVVHPVNPCQNADKFNTRCAQLIGKCFPVLEKLSLGGRIIDISALVFIAKQCKKLKYVELHHMSMLTKEIVEQICEHGFNSIKIIKLMSTPIQPEAITILKDNCKYLETMYIRLSVNDYFNGTDQTEDLKVFEEVMGKYEDLRKDQKLRRILKLKINKI